MRNPVLEDLDILVGEWALTLSDAWFLESRNVRQSGRATVRWLGEGFLEMQAGLGGEPQWHFVFGRSDPGEQLLERIPGR